MSTLPPSAGDPVGELDRQRFDRHGYLVVRRFADPELVARMRAVAEESLDPLLGPAEYEADVHYPGAPADRAAPGGETPRRLLHAMTRDGVFRE
ncbi:MAG: hypothetical protein V2J02_01750, partial [Pseudomonadales bacterium]|nr:hypothetical protein [Pseudomonadales bacterium]